MANSSAAPPPGYTRPGTYNRDDAATTGVQTIRFPRNAQVASALGVTAVNAGRPGAVVSDKPVEEKKLKKHKPWFIWTVSLIQVATLVASIFINKNMTGEYIQTTPVWNYMSGLISDSPFLLCLTKVSTGLDLQSAQHQE